MSYPVKHTKSVRFSKTDAAKLEAMADEARKLERVAFKETERGTPERAAALDALKAWRKANGEAFESLDMRQRAHLEHMTATIGRRVESLRAMHPNNKEIVNRLQYITTIADGSLSNVIDARFYMGRASSSRTVYCSVWIHYNGFETSGRGSAGGGGYHKESAALEEAMRAAGITFDRNIGGADDSAMRDALAAVARAIGARGKACIC